jgi:hypothetical protein
MAETKNLNTVQQYAGDMVALESHIEEALDRQLKEVEGYPRAAEAVQRFHTLVRSQRDAMRAHLQSIGGSEPSGIKGAVASIFGAAAGVIDKMRTKEVSKALRDDYTAFNLAAIGYAMLHTTAHLLGEARTADIAERHMRGYARAIQEINQIIADVVAAELREEGHAMDEQMVRHATETINRVWRETSPTGSGSTSPVA